MAMKFPFRVKHTTSNTGARTSYTLSTAAAPAGYRLFSRAVTDSSIADGDQCAYLVIDTTVVGGVNLFEMGTCTFHNTNPPTVDTLTVMQSSNGGSSVTWGAGTRDFFVCDNPLAFAVLANAGSDYTSVAAAFRTAIGLGTAAVAALGTAANNALQIRSDGKYPALDGSLITGLPASPIPSGSKLPFYTNAAPSGWTLDNSIDDMVMCLTNNSGTGGGGPNAGGTTGGVGWDATFGMTSGGHALAGGEIPTSFTAQSGSGALAVVGSIITGAAHTHPLTSASTWRPPSAYFRLCTKN